MSAVFSSTAGLLVLFTLIVMGCIALVLSAANGLSTFHKDVLVSFCLGFPSVVLIILLVLMRAEIRN